MIYPLPIFFSKFCKKNDVDKTTKNWSECWKIFDLKIVDLLYKYQITGRTDFYFPKNDLQMKDKLLHNKFASKSTKKWCCCCHKTLKFFQQFWSKQFWSKTKSCSVLYQWNKKTLTKINLCMCIRIFSQGSKGPLTKLSWSMYF